MFVIFFFFSSAGSSDKWPLLRFLEETELLSGLLVASLPSFRSCHGPRDSSANRPRAASLRIQVPELLNSEKKDLERRRGAFIPWSTAVGPEEWAERLELWKFFHQSRHSLAMRFVHSISIY